MGSDDAVQRSAVLSNDSKEVAIGDVSSAAVRLKGCTDAEFLGGILLLAGATAWAYANSFDGVSIFDDEAHIKPHLLSGGWLEGSIPNRPLVQASLVLNYRLGGMDLWGYHAFNLIVHILCGLLLFGIIRRTLLMPACHSLGLSPLASDRLAWGAALVWLLHPLNTQSVTYVIQRCESLAGMFTLACLYAVIRGASGTRGWLWYFLSLASFRLALASKENALTTPLILFTYDFVFLASSVHETIRKRWMLYAGLVLLTALALPGIWSILMTTDGSVGLHTSNNLTPWKYARSQPGVILHYLRLAIWPTPLCLDYRWMIARSFTEIVIPGAIITVLFIASLWAVWRRDAKGFLGLSFFLLLAPTSSFAPLADLAFEHRMYLPLACMTTALVCLFALSTVRIAERRAWSAQFTAVFLAVMLLSTGTVLGLSTARRNLDYHSPVQMWTSVVRVRPQNYRGWSSLGVACDLVGDHQHARECFERAIAIHDRDAGSLLGLGLNCLKSGELDRARWAFERGLDIDPKMVDAASNLGVIAARMGDYEAAIKHFDRAISIQPEFCVGYYNRADSLIEVGRDADAVEALQAALRIKPDFTQAARKLAWVRATSPNLTLRDGSEAVQLIESKCQPKESQSVHTWDAYGAALAEAGCYDEAIRAADRAIELANASQKTQLTDEITLRRNIYRTHQPYRVVRRRVTSSKEQVSP